MPTAGPNWHFQLKTQLWLALSPAASPTRRCRVGRSAAGSKSRLFGNWTAKVEYLYVDLGWISGTATAVVPANPPISLISTSAHIRDNIVRGGRNYKF